MDKQKEQLYLEKLKKASEKIRALMAEVAVFKDTGPVAVIGMGCRFPGGADTPEKFWELLATGKDAITKVPPGRWDSDLYYDAHPHAPGKSYARHGGFLDNIDQFDNVFFGIPPAEARAMDPQHRLLLEVTHEALEYGGINPDDLKGSATGVFVGFSTRDYLQAHLESGDPGKIDEFSLTGTAFSTAVGRISYRYDLKGPSMAIDTACSSALVALHMAVRQLRSRECDLAMVGGCNAMVTPEPFVGFSKLQALSRDGRCHTFDNAANGYVRGEGCGMVVLKRLDDARRDRDRILAVVQGSAVNQDGESNGLTAPNAIAQKNVIRAALNDAGCSPADIDYIECHGTGTRLGDPQEARALGMVFNGRQSKLLVGSVKTNIGHLEAAAGMPGLIKTILALEHRQIPPSLHFKTPSEHIPWTELPIEVVDGLRPWPKTKDKAVAKDKTGAKRKSVAGLSGFGFSGTNAHVVLTGDPDRDEGQEEPEDKSPERPLHLLPLSARDGKGLTLLAGRYRHFLKHTSLAWTDICHTAALGRKHFKHRMVVAAATKAGAAKQLGLAIDQGIDHCRAQSSIQSSIQSRVQGSVPGVTMTQARGETVTGKPKIVFMFTGQGAQYAGMGKQLYDTQPVFRDVIGRCARILSGEWDMDLLDLLYGPLADEDQLRDTVHTQPLMFAVEYALAELWRSWGIRPSMVMGHSIGEYVAACIAGVFSLEEGLGLAVERGRLIRELAGSGGAMAAVFAHETQVGRELEAVDGPLSVASLNSPENTVVSGDARALGAFLNHLDEKGINAHRLTVSHGFHSSLMEPARNALEAVVAGVSMKGPRIPLISNLTGKVVKAEEITRPGYWGAHLTSTVRFLDMVRTARNMGGTLFLEIGPHVVLGDLAKVCLEDVSACLDDSTGRSGNAPACLDVAPGSQEKSTCLCLPSLIRGADDWETLLGSLAAIHAAGMSVDWQGFDAPYTRHKVTLPFYPFQPRSFWMNPVRPLPDSSKENGPGIADPTSNSMIGHDVQPEQKDRFMKQRNALESIGNSFPKGELDGLIHRQLEVMSKQLSLIAGSASSPALGGEMPHGMSKLPETLETQDSSDTQDTREMPEMKDMPDILETIDTPGTPSMGILNLCKQGRDNQPNANVDIRSMTLLKDTLNKRQQAFVEAFIDRYTARTQGSKAIMEKNRPWFSDWINSLGFRMTLKEIMYPIVCSRARGTRLYDVDGNDYIDMAMGYGVNYFGNNAPFVVAAVEEQLKKGFQLATQFDETGDVARLITEITGVERVTFSNTGTEAVMVALRMARTMTGRDKIVIFKDSYHGIFDGVLALPGVNGSVPMAPGTSSKMIADVIVLPYGQPESLEFIKTHGRNLAAVLVEPVQSRNPSLTPGPFLKELREITQTHRTALIFDEIITGFRLCPGGAQAFFHVQADIVIYGKLIGGGLPISVIAGKARFMDAIDGGNWQYGDDSMPDKAVTFFGGTFCKHPLAMAAARAVLTHLREQGDTLQKNVNQLTKLFADQLNHWFEEHAVPLRIHFCASFFCFVSEGDFDPVFQPLILDLLFYLMMSKGVYTWERRICFFSTVHTLADLEQILGVIKESVAEIQAGGFDFGR
ncbi:MAG: aminotransferase class III-fold pyridoxal phosphate-dependent enzyme [Desulfobacterium sp.]|nr:aminotransferase class III-fold pyridoxal phosphate-dependent enzyme [Desulfobacterium sp.]